MSLVLDVLGAVRLTDLFDVALVAVLLWVGIAWLRTTRARTALVGLLILGGIYFLARLIGLSLTASILQWFVAASVIVVVVVFQEDIRRLFERIGALGLRPAQLVAVTSGVGAVTRALARLAEQRRGALIVIPGRDPLDRHVEGGVDLDAHITEPLLLSLFDPHSPGHDGAVVLAGERVARFAVHLPLSGDHVQLGQLGTRHAAALGLAERVDALCLVVSEERGTVSVALGGKLRSLARPGLVAEEIRGFLASLSPQGVARLPWWRRLVGRSREAAAAIGAALLLWLLAVPGTGVVEVERPAAVRVMDLPPGYVLERIDPAEVRVTLAGRRMDFWLTDSRPLEVHLNTALVGVGRRSFTVTPDQIDRPEGTEVMAIEPDLVTLSLKAVGRRRRD